MSYKSRSVCICPNKLRCVCVCVFTPEISCPRHCHLYLVSQEMDTEYFGLWNLSLQKYRRITSISATIIDLFFHSFIHSFCALWVWGCCVGELYVEMLRFFLNIVMYFNSRDRACFNSTERKSLGQASMADVSSSRECEGTLQWLFQKLLIFCLFFYYFILCSCQV